MPYEYHPPQPHLAIKKLLTVGETGWNSKPLKVYFDDKVKERLKHTGCYLKTVEKEHGGVAVREYYITEDIVWYSEKQKWKGLRSFGMVEKRLEKSDGTTEEAIPHYICSKGEDAEKFERGVKGALGC